MSPFDDFAYLINHVLLGQEPTIEDFILLVGTLVAFIAFILWCCFPIQPKEPGQHRQFTCKIIKNHIKSFDVATSTDDNNIAATVINNSGGNNNVNRVPIGYIINGGNNNNSGSNNTQYNGNGGHYSKSGTVAMHNYYVKSGHHCCT